MALLTLYNGLTGASTKVAAGEGLRQKAWLDEIARWLMEAVETVELKGLGLGRLANYPQFLDGNGLSANPIGTPAPSGSYAGASVFEVIANRQLLGVGTGAATAFGNEALTQPDPTNNAYGKNGTDTNATLPAGGTHPAFITSAAETFDLTGATSLSVTVNGYTFSVTITASNIAAVTAEEVVASLVTAGVPVEAIAANTAGNARLLSRGRGRAQTIRVNAGSAGSVLFSGKTGVTFFGNGGPLNDSRSSTDGIKPQRRVLPGSVTVYGTISSAVVTLLDDGAGVLSGGAGAHTGTIDYATGVVSVTFGTAPDNATNVFADFKALVPLALHEPVRVPPSGKEVAVILN